MLNFDSKYFIFGPVKIVLFILFNYLFFSIIYSFQLFIKIEWNRYDREFRVPRSNVRYMDSNWRTCLLRRTFLYIISEDFCFLLSCYFYNTWLCLLLIIFLNLNFIFSFNFIHFLFSLFFIYLINYFVFLGTLDRCAQCISSDGEYYGW